MNTRTRFATFAAALLLAGMIGCQSTERELAPAVGLTASNSEIMANETTTLFAKTQNLAGRDSQVRWKTTHGELEVSKDGRQARLRADQPGEALVTVEVTTTDGQILRDQKKVEIKPLPR